MERIRVASLFCGLGGMDVGLRGGFTYLGKKYPKLLTKAVYANDIYPQACDMFEKNLGVPCDRRDVRTILAREIPDHDLLTAGFPCQSFSIVAQNPPRLGCRSEGGRLFSEVVRILKEKQPKAFLAENVKGLISANGGKTFPLMLKAFTDAGYEVDSSLVNAAEWGIPQKRERVIIIGIRKDLRIKPKFPRKPSAREVPLKSVLLDCVYVDAKYFFSKRALRGLSKANPKMNKGRVQNIEKPCATVTSHLAKMSINSTDPVLNIDGRLRRLLPREVARIQSFPDQFELMGSDFHQYKGLGNAVPPVLMWHFGKHLTKLLEKKGHSYKKTS